MEMNPEYKDVKGDGMLHDLCHALSYALYNALRCMMYAVCMKMNPEYKDIKGDGDTITVTLPHHHH
jgi:hypothetical protein